MEDLKRIKISTLTGMTIPEDIWERMDVPIDAECLDDIPYPGPVFELPIKQVIKKFGEPDVDKTRISEEEEYYLSISFMIREKLTQQLFQILEDEHQEYVQRADVPKVLKSITSVNNATIILTRSSLIGGRKRM